MDLTNPNAFLKASIDKFFANANTKKAMTMVIYNESMSLRTLDWFVSNFSKKNNVMYTTTDGRLFNVFLEYKAQLKSYGKKWFDPFCRGERVEYEDAEGNEFTTTLGQLNFFRWALKNEIVDYCLERIDVIEDDMTVSTKNRRTDDASFKRRELSKAVIKRCVNMQTRVTIKFD